MQQLQAIAQTGLHYANSPFDVERYERLLEIAVQIGAANSPHDETVLLEQFRAQTGYATPRVDVRAACFRNGKILLVQERTDERWALPGGWADVGDGPAAAAEREVLEESGYRCRAAQLIGIFDANRAVGALPLYHAYKIVFRCELLGEAEPLDSPEILDARFFGSDELPPLSENRTWEALVQECFRHAADPNRPAHFE
jgi:ADP-ribose pyrophosphatase YjhB (NUDIX family)